MSKVRLKRARVVAVVGQLKAASVTEHVSMRLDAQIGYDGCPFNHAAKSLAPRVARRVLKSQLLKPQ